MAVLFTLTRSSRKRRNAMRKSSVRESLVSALTKKVLDEQTFCRVARKYFDFARAPRRSAMNAKLLPALRVLLTRMVFAFRDPRPRAKVERLALGLLCAEGPKTITSALGSLETTL